MPVRCRCMQTEGRMCRGRLGTNGRIIQRLKPEDQDLDDAENRFNAPFNSWELICMCSGYNSHVFLHSSIMRPKWKNEVESEGLRIGVIAYGLLVKLSVWNENSNSDLSSCSVGLIPSVAQIPIYWYVQNWIRNLPWTNTTSATLGVPGWHSSMWIWVWK
jgi:hypothetical protein